MTDLTCELCGEHAVRDTRPMEYAYKGHKITLDQPGTYCNSCGEVLLGAKDLEATRLDLMDFHAEVDHILGPRRVMVIRKALRPIYVY